MNVPNLNKKYILAGSILNSRKYVISQALLNNPLFNYEECSKTMLVNTFLNNKKRMISDKESAFIIYDLFKNNYFKYVNNNKYNQETFTIKAIQKLLELINDYRLSFSNNHNLIFDINYQALINDYKNYLDDNNLIDYIFALEETKNIKANATLLILDDIYLSPKEKMIFNNIFNDVKEIKPREYNNKIISSYPCYGIYNEILNVLNVIKLNNYSINDTEILYLSDSYENLIRGTLDSFNINYSITGAHAKSTNLISFMLDILDYIKNDYRYELLESILKNSGLSNVYLNEFYKSLDLRYSSFSVGFGKERTIEFVNKIKDVNELENIKEFLNDLTLFGDEISFDYHKFLFFSYKYLNNGNEKNVLENKLDNLKNIIELSDNKIDDLIDELSSLRYTENVNNSLQISMINKSFSLKKNLFIIGLNQNNVAKVDAENPFIINIDKYINELGDEKYLHVVKNKKKQIEEALDYYINYSNSNIHLSYSYFDKIEFRPSAPSVYYLNKDGVVFNGENGINLYKIEKDVVSFSDINFSLSDKDVIQNYDNGKINELIDNANHFENDIKNIINKKSYKNNNYYLSPSALQTLVECPFRYYYEKIVHLPNPSYPGADTSIWLDANSKGTFFHRILELYGNKTKFINSFDKALFDQMFDIALDETKALSPIKNYDIASTEIEDVKKYAKEKIIEIIDDYKYSGYNLLDCEYSLSKTGYKYHDISFIGFIDRVDYKIIDSVLHIRIIDYKTGSYKDKKESKYLQHVIYSICLKEANNKLFDLKYEKIIIDEFIYDYAFANKKNIYNTKEIDDYIIKTFEIIDDLLNNYLNNGECFIDFEKYFDNHKIESNNSFADKPLCEYCNYKKTCYKRLKEGKEWQA